MVDQIMELPEGTKIQLLAPVVRGRKGRHEKLLEKAKKSGYVRVRIDGNLYELSEEISLDKNIKHNIEIIVDRLVVREGIQKRLTDSIESVLALAEGLLVVDVIGGEPLNFSQSFSCRIVESVSKRLNREVFLLIIHLGHVRFALDWDTRWSLM